MNPRSLRQTTLLVFLLALVLRTAWLDRFPPGLWFDEGLKGVDSWHTFHPMLQAVGKDALGQERFASVPPTGPLLVYPAVFPREPLFVWILGLVLSVLGPRTIAMRLTAAIISALACAAFFRMVARVERNRGLPVALAAAFVLATLHWHAHFGRLVFRTNLVPLFSSLYVLAAFGAAAYAARRGRTTRTALAWIGLGALAGSGFYTYLSWYFFAPVGLVWLWAAAGQDEVTSTGAATRPRWPAAFGLFAVGGLALALPIWLHYALSPQDLLARPAAASPFQGGSFVDGLRVMGANLRDVLLMFSFRGDVRVIHNLPGSPVLDPVWSLCFLGGLAATAHDALRGPTVGVRRRAVAWLAWLAVMSLPSVVSYNDPASANMLRNLGATPPLAWLTARGWLEAFAWTRRLAGRARRWAPWAAIALLLWGGGFQTWKLLVRHPAQKAELREKFESIDLQLAALCTRDKAGAPVYVPTPIYGGESYRFQFLTIARDDVRPLDLAAALSRDANGTPPRDHRVLCTFFQSDNWTMTPRLYDALRRFFPQGELEPIPLALLDRQIPGRVFRIPAAALLAPEDARRTAQEIATAATAKP